MPQADPTEPTSSRRKEGETKQYKSKGGEFHIELRKRRNKNK